MIHSLAMYLQEAWASHHDLVVVLATVGILWVVQDLLIPARWNVKLERFQKVAYPWIILGLFLGVTISGHWPGRVTPDDWVVVSLAPLKIEDLLPSSSRVPKLTGLVNDPEFGKLTLYDAYTVMRSADPSLEDASDYKLAMLVDLLSQPPRSPGLSVTLRHLGNLYKASCSFSKLHYTDPDMPEEFANRDQPCGKLVSQYVGKTVPDWPSGGQKPAIGIQLWVGVSPDPKWSTLSFVANTGREEDTEEYRIWSVETPIDYIVRETPPGK